MGKDGKTRVGKGAKGNGGGKGKGKMGGTGLRTGHGMGKERERREREERGYRLQPPQTLIPGAATVHIDYCCYHCRHDNNRPRPSDEY